MLDLIKMDILVNLNVFFIENTVDQLASLDVFHTDWKYKLSTACNAAG